MEATVRLGEIRVVTTGEAAPTNNKSATLAVAEERALDRAYLKLLDIHGDIYSDGEMDGEGSTMRSRRAGSPAAEDAVEKAYTSTASPTSAKTEHRPKPSTKTTRDDRAVARGHTRQRVMSHLKGHRRTRHR